ncbi:tumor protein D52-like isoform X2 [Paramacrobiotus metropolitanus]|uniref:tumor protein D52-like isoform X2 n=1 Tax=Paramacrobiotus metropolitanus TaxID=2943436 RepID=UPI00244619CD|nr:tumor protein D52-like isoform X2 [Paramacrobiotus metropolitanus]XP_055334535.1 tumor protein D52-like isoform X2 [Paramacrobiotus metropolitanus]
MSNSGPPSQPRLPSDNETFYDPLEDGHGDRENKDLTPEERVRLEQEWKEELTKTEEEIDTLRRVLSSKLRHAQDLKRKLGITVWQEVQSDLAEGFKTVKESQAVKKLNEAVVTVEDKVAASPVYQKTSESLKTIGDKTGAMFQSFSGETRKKLGELRNTNAFKSVEGAVTAAATAVQKKVQEVATPSADRERTTLEGELRGGAVSGATTPTSTTTTTTITTEKKA